MHFVFVFSQEDIERFREEMIRHQSQAAGQKSQPEIDNHAHDSQKASSPVSVTPETNDKTPKGESLPTENLNGCKEEPAVAEVPAESSPENGVPVSR